MAPPFETKSLSEDRNAFNVAPEGLSMATNCEASQPLQKGAEEDAYSPTPGVWRQMFSQGL